ncbi:hypothetical protein LCGC14_2182710 [marine sediment metagenome]|uniref:DUF559 domain-containing protein n=1 Tax=marine sediment metagenome TaxID=412755 RepID=A0A0F9GHL0_9ZZZZ
MDINHVKRPQWCPSCAEGESEIICRGFFERIFNTKFPKARLKWLMNPLTGGQMHFDGYCKELKLVFEFNGPQHYRMYPKFHKSYQDFVRQQERDKVKALLCQRHGVTLITVPHTLEYDEFQEFIINEYTILTGKKLKIISKYDWRTFRKLN